MGIESACDYGPWLEEKGYTSSSKTYDKAKTGDICIFESSDNHDHGHIQVYCDDGKWRSDFT